MHPSSAVTIAEGHFDPRYLDRTDDQPGARWRRHRTEAWAPPRARWRLRPPPPSHPNGRRSWLSGRVGDGLDLDGDRIPQLEPSLQRLARRFLGLRPLSRIIAAHPL